MRGLSHLVEGMDSIPKAPEQFPCCSASPQAVLFATDSPLPEKIIFQFAICSGPRGGYFYAEDKKAFVRQ